MIARRYMDQARGRKTEESGFDSHQGKGVLSSQNRPDLAWNPPSLIFSEDRGLVPR